MHEAVSGARAFFGRVLQTPISERVLFFTIPIYNTARDGGAVNGVVNCT